MTRFKNTAVLFSLLALTFSSSALAEVSLKNGNFFTGSKDIIYPGGFEPKIERVYNSKTSHKGAFGNGWGNEYEVSLTVSADGSVVVHEYGGGAENRFDPLAFNSQELDRAVDVIVKAATKAGAAGTGDQTAAYRKHLKSDAMFRNDEWEKFRSQGKIQARQLPVGTQLHSNRFSYQYVTKVAGGYVRTFDNGRIEKFNDEGKLERISDKNGNFIDLTYGKDGHLDKLVDNFNRKMYFSYNAQGLLERIQGENNKECQYRYNNQAELTWVKDSAGGVYTYKYDAEKRHNMIEMGYPDKTTMQLTYYPYSQFENVKSVKDRDGTLTEYKYVIDSGDKRHYTVSVSVKNTEGKRISESSYEYINKVKADGEEWTYKMVTTLDGDRTETTYNECCGLPLLIKRGREETAFEYDTKGHVTKKITPSEVTELAYDPRVSKVTRVAHYSKTNKNQMNWSTFQYDNKGNLVFAKNSEGKGVRLFYDPSGRIKSLLDQDRRRIDFKYNENSKPIEITDPAVGTIRVSYTNSGEIKKVDSTAGRKIALQVTTAFQNLLDIIRPAGVNLSF
jgi:YD repeat-containing protein